MKIRATTATLTSLIAASALALSACGDDPTMEKVTDGTASTEATETPSEEPSTEPTESESADTGAAPTGDVTAPGTELAIGEGATVPFESGNDGSGVIEIVVDEIAEGKPADLAPLDLGDQAKGLVPYYINLTVTGVSGSDTLQNYSVNEDVEGLLPDGSEAQALSIIGSWEPCDNESFPGDFADGTSFTTCIPYLAPEASEVAGAQYAPYEGDYNPVDGAPVVWK